MKMLTVSVDVSWEVFDNADKKVNGSYQAVHDLNNDSEYSVEYSKGPN